MTNIAERLETARQELLDLTLRNPLINYRPLRSKGLQIIDELSAEIFRILVVENRALSFMPAKEQASDSLARDGEDNDFEIQLEQEVDTLTEGLIAERHLDEKLQTPYSSSILQKRLLNTYYSALTYIEEQGVNVLYLALGMLNWYESSGSTTRRQAPLILVPVALDRANVNTRFQLHYTEDELSENLSLQAKLKQEFGLKLPNLFEKENFEIQTYFDQVEKCIRSLEHWSVDRTSMVLGFFAFGKFLMFHDLDESLWPEEAKPTAHPIMKALLQDGFHNIPSVTSDETDIDQLVSPKESNHVIDADSSQIRALLDIKEGRNLVIQGPPGTGKSQTITNIIAEALGQEKKVLFVAEKMAALEVVKRRLDMVGLGEACLELHSQKSAKKVLLAELQRTLDLGQPKQPEERYYEQLLFEYQSQLNAYAEAVNNPIEQSGVTPYNAYGELLTLNEKLNNIALPPLNDALFRAWTGADFHRRIYQIGEFQGLLSRIGTPSRHLFWGSQLRQVLPGDKEKLKKEIQEAGKSIKNLWDCGKKIVNHLSLEIPGSRKELETLLALATRLTQAPHLTGLSVESEDWLMHSQLIQDTVESGAKLAKIRSSGESWLLPHAWEQDVREIHQSYANYGAKWWRFLSGNFRQAQNNLRALCKKQLPSTIEAQIKIIRAITEVQRLQKIVTETEPLLKRLFNAQWQDWQSDWNYFSDVAGWIISLYKDIKSGAAPAEFIHSLKRQSEQEELHELVAAAHEYLDAQSTSISKLLLTLKLDEPKRFKEAGSFQALSFKDQLQLLGVWFKNIDKVQEIATYNIQADQISQMGMSTILPVAAGWPKAGQCLTDLVTKYWYEYLIRLAFTTRPPLQTFSRDIHESRIEKFRILDHKLFELNRINLATRHWRHLPRHDAGGQLGILKREFAKKQRHLPIRKLMQQAGNVIQTLKPVFMMSPMSVATFLPPGSVTFDLVIFDEASQVTPVDAFGAILRGNQTVVVGDSRQLPPTSFFNQIAEIDEDVESPTADLESILTLFLAQSAPECILRWHYRSRHESLITVSNSEFYNNKLIVFPSPITSRTELGVIFHHLPETVYDLGKSRTNPKEAQIVAEAVMAHARNCPELSLGVAAFSVSQMEAIQYRLEPLRKQEPSCETFFNSHPEEPFFVKNLENVQGDERDVIFISVGYGRDANGRVSMNFGPLNKDGGERRLNVLITRAKRRCEVFTNLTADDIDLSRSQTRGVISFKQYLKYAQTGELELPLPSGKEPDSPFEEAVAKALSQAGYKVDFQVGTAGFFIDLAVIDEENPGRYLLGIECDGATYHSARSARDRDRIRQNVLEDLGWQIHRIWSTDWFKDPRKELQRVLESIEATKKKKPMLRTKSVTKSTNSTSLERREDKSFPATIQSRKYQMAQLNIQRSEYARSELPDIPSYVVAGWVHEIVALESPVHADEVRRRICEAFGIKRAGTRIQGIIQEAIKLAENRGKVRQRDQFLWKNAENRLDKIRDRSDLPNVSKKLNLVAPEEIALAVETVIKNAFGMKENEIPPAVSAAFGFSRTSNDMNQHIQNIINQLKREHKLIGKGDFLIVSDK